MYKKFLHIPTVYKVLLPQGKKVVAARCEYVFEVKTSEASKRLKVVPLHLWRINIKTTSGFINIPLEDFLIDNLRNKNITNCTVYCSFQKKDKSQAVIRPTQVNIQCSLQFKNLCY